MRDGSPLRPVWLPAHMPGPGRDRHRPPVRPSVSWARNTEASLDVRCMQIRRAAAMRTTFNLDEELLGEAQRLTGMTERTAVIHEGLRALIERESARRLARLGASERALRMPPRRRSKAARGK